MKNIFKTIILLIVCAFLFCALLSSCDEEGNGGSVTPQNSAENVSDIEGGKEQNPTNKTENSGDTTTAESTAASSVTSEHVHSFGDWKVTITSTCNLEGTAERVCVCGEKETKSLDKLAHTEVKDEAVPPTCEKEGKTEGKHCSSCLTVTLPQEIIAALGHSEEIDITVPPTCDKPGLTEGKHCSVCSTILVTQIVINPTGHTPGDWVVGLPATISVNGLKYQLCKSCNTKLDEEIILATGSLGLEYKPTFPGLLICTVKGIGTCTDKDLYIGPLIEEHRIIAISDSAFKSNASIKNVTVKANLDSVGNQAFMGCASLTSVILPDTVEVFGHYAFAECTALKSIKMPTKLSDMSSYTFYNCSSLTNIVLSEDVFGIRNNVFEGCSSLESITIPKTVTFIQEDAFKGCSSLRTINFKGTSAEWNAITKSSGWNANTGDYLVKCSDKTLTK